MKTAQPKAGDGLFSRAAELLNSVFNRPNADEDDAAPPPRPQRGASLPSKASLRMSIARFEEEGRFSGDAVDHEKILTKRVSLNREQGTKFASNRVITSRYTILNFVPRSLFSLLNPFNRFANFYFLVVGCLQAVPAITITEGRAGTFMPLSFVLFVDMLMRAIEDYARHRSDAETNSKPVDVLHGTSARPVMPDVPIAPWDLGYDDHGSRNSSVGRKSGAIGPTAAGPCWQTLPWDKVRVGDVVRVGNRGAIPADLLLLGASPEAGSAWVNTKPLDGESDTKLRMAVAPTSLQLEGLRGPEVAERLARFDGTLLCELPNDKVNDFVGRLKLCPSGQHKFGGARVTVDRDNMLLRGCQLRNTEAAFGMVVSAGVECKINFSGKKLGEFETERTGHIASAVNIDVAGVAVLLVLVCCVGASGAMIWMRDGGNPWYLALYPPPPAVEPWTLLETTYQFLCQLGRFFLLSYQFIPVSLYVSMSMVCSFNSYFVTNDLRLYDEEQDEPCRVRSMALLEDLGQVTHVFSDKTGTLTANHMEFRRCLVGGVAYGSGATAISAFLDAQGRIGRATAATGTAPPICAPGVTPPAVAPATARPPPAGLAVCKATTEPYVNYEEAAGSPSLVELLRQPELQAAAVARDLLIHLALNHSVMLEPVDGQEDLCASSPDELAFVSAAEYFGIEFTARDASRGRIQLRDKASGETLEVELLDVFPYESSRKRMSVVVRLPPSLLPPGSSCREVLYCKGADSVLLNALDADAHDPELIEHTESTLGEWSEIALRTLVFCRRELPHFEEWRKRYDEAHEDPEELRRYRAGDACRITELQAELETQLTLQGATAIEDKLQDGVPEVLADLRAAGVKVWMLTGDKVGTAKNIAAACNILPASVDPLEITEDAVPPLKELTTASMLAVHYENRHLLTDALEGGDTERADAETAYENAVIQSLQPKYPVVAAIRQALEEKAAEMAESSNSARHALVIDERAIELCGMAMPKLLASVANGSRSVVACRARKDQKAQLLQLIRRRVPGSVCLGIGDGANDVAMLKAAHVGVGIIGKEGAQAVNNSDIAIGQFRFLRPLMFVHGRNIYRRLPVLVFYIFYKNIIETLVQYWFTTSAAWSGETPFVQLVINWYNMFYTAIPIIAFAFNDSDLPAEVAEASPAAYQIGLAARWYSHRRFWLWQLEALYFSLVVLYGPFLALSVAAAHTQDGATPGHFEVGVVVQNLVVVCATIRLVLELHVITVVEVVAYVGSLIFWALNLYMFSEVNAPAGMCYECWGPWNDAATVLLSPIAMLTSLVLGAIVLTPRWASKAWNAVRGSETKEMRATAIAAVRPTRQTRGRRTKMAKPPMMRKYSSKAAGEAGFAFSVDERSARRALGFDVKRPA